MNRKTQLVLDIMKLGIEISETTKTDVIVEYYGQSDQLIVVCFAGGWGNASNKRDIDVEIYLKGDGYLTEESIISLLEETYSELAKYREDSDSDE